MGEGGHAEFAERLMECALNARDAKRAAKRYHSLYRKSRGFGIFALRDIKVGLSYAMLTYQVAH